MTGEEWVALADNMVQMRRERVRLRAAVRRLRKFAQWCSSEESDGEDIGLRAADVLSRTDGVL